MAVRSDQQSARRFVERFTSPGIGGLTATEAGPLTLPIRRRGHRRLLIHGALMIADLCALTIALMVAARVGGSTVDVWTGLALLLILPLWVLAADINGLYTADERRPDHNTLDDVIPVFTIVAIGTWIGLAASSLTGFGDPTINAAIVFCATGFVLVLGGRATARSIVRRRSSYLQNTIIIGAGDVGQLVGRKMIQHPEFGINLVGFVDSEPKQMRTDLSAIPLLGPPEDIVSLVRKYNAERVVVAFSNDRHDLLVDLVRSLRTLDVQIDLVPRLFEAVGPAVGMHAVEGLPLVGLHSSRASRGALATKRAIDLVAGTMLLILAAPVFIVAAWQIRRDSPGQIFFRQTRLGKNMKPFTVYKFRTMRVNTDPGPHREFLKGIMSPAAVTSSENGNLYKLERRDVVTKPGTWLRRTSLDELPQLLNVIRGDMSLVGPRPCIEYETELFEPHHFDRFLVPAGMTGLWQVAARAHSTFKEALDLDAAYAQSWSLALDLRLLLQTPWVIIRGKETT